MTKITFEQIVDIFDKTEGKWEGDNAVQGIDILRKYFNKPDDSIICGADHDVIYSVDVNLAIHRGLTKEDAEKLARLNWIIEDGYFSCFV